MNVISAKLRFVILIMRMMSIKKEVPDRLNVSYACPWIAAFNYVIRSAKNQKSESRA